MITATAADNDVARVKGSKKEVTIEIQDVTTLYDALYEFKY